MGNGRDGACGLGIKAPPFFHTYVYWQNATGEPIKSEDRIGRRRRNLRSREYRDVIYGPVKSFVPRYRGINLRNTRTRRDGAVMRSLCLKIWGSWRSQSPRAPQLTQNDRYTVPQADDPELEAIRQRRMAELMGGGAKVGSRPLCSELAVAHTSLLPASTLHAAPHVRRGAGGAGR